MNISYTTRQRLEVAPAAGSTHLWLAQVAGGLRRVLSAEQCAAFLRRCCDEFTHHRVVPDREIQDAVAFAYGGGTRKPGPKWPNANATFIGKVLAIVEPLFEAGVDTSLKARDVLPLLYRPGELVCVGADSERAVVRPVEEVLVEAEGLQFICVNPMKGSLAVNNAGRPSVRCQNNVLARRYLVTEFDDATITKSQQAQLMTALADMAPLVMVVDAAGKSLHGWFLVEAMTGRDQTRFFALACLLGADPTRWDICGWLRMPGGLRPMADGSRVRQRILYFNQEALSGQSIAP